MKGRSIVGLILLISLCQVSGAALGQLTQINLQSPTDGSNLASAPTFSWNPDGGTINVYVVDFHIPGLVPLWTTPVLSGPSWAMPQTIWDFIPTETEVLWRARGADLADPPLNIIISDEVWSFHKIASPGWMRTFGGAEVDRGYSVQQTSDGGYIITGETFSYGAGSNDVWLIKTDANGNKVWDKTFGGEYSDAGQSVQQTTDGGYIITGKKSRYGNMADVWLIKTDSNGNRQWDKTFWGVSGDYGRSVRQTSDGGYIITGETYSYGPQPYSNVLLIKTDAAGNTVWGKAFGRGGEYDDVGYSVQQTSDGGYIITGYTAIRRVFMSDVWLIKTDSSGNKQWDKTFGRMPWDAGYSVQQTSDGGYIIAGDTASYLTNISDVWLIKTDSSGNRQWDKTLGGTEWDVGYSVQQTSDGDYVITGYTEALGTYTWNVLLIKTDANGDKIWDKTFEGAYSDVGYSVQQTSDGGYIITGSGRADVLLIKTDENGNVTLP